MDLWIDVPMKTHTIQKNIILNQWTKTFLTNWWCVEIYELFTVNIEHKSAEVFENTEV